MTVKRFNLWLVLNCLLFLAINLIAKKSMFSAGENDGFFLGIQASKSFSWNGMEYLLELVHAVRFVVAYPFLWIFEHGYPPVFESMVLLGYMLPIANAEFNGKKKYFQVAFLYFPFFISYRSVLVACSVGYLFLLIYSEKKSSTLVWISALLANLSSGVVMGWLLVVLSNYRRLSSKTRKLSLIVACMLLSLSFSLSQKVEFFSDEARATDTSNGAVEAFQRNTLIVSYENHQYARLVIYCLAVLMLMVILVHGMLQKRGFQKSSWFYVCSIPGLFMEGLSVLAFVVPILWFYLGIRPRTEVSHSR
jgi:hypothetical protein